MDRFTGGCLCGNVRRFRRRTCFFSLRSRFFRRLSSSLLAWGARGPGSPAISALDTSDHSRRPSSVSTAKPRPRRRLPRRPARPHPVGQSRRPCRAIQISHLQPRGIPWAV